jgi:Fe2+ transport system protein FeoA
VTLSQLKRGDSALITRVEATDSTLARLASRGIVPGTYVDILISGDPCLIATSNDEWALSNVEASGIHVTCEVRLASKLKALFSWS